MNEKVYQRLIGLPYLLLLLVVAALYYGLIEAHVVHHKALKWLTQGSLLVILGLASAALTKLLFYHFPDLLQSYQAYWWIFVLINPVFLGFMFASYTYHKVK